MIAKLDILAIMGINKIPRAPHIDVRLEHLKQEIRLADLYRE